MFSELSDCVCEVHLEIYEGTMFCPTKWNRFSSGACLKLCEARVPVKPVNTEVLMMYTYEVSCLLSMKYHVATCAKHVLWACCVQAQGLEVNGSGVVMHIPPPLQIVVGCPLTL